MRLLNAFLALLLIGASPAMAQTSGSDQAPTPLPEAAPPAMQPLDDSLEPQVTIQQREGNTVEEYRVNGKLYKIRVVPGNGAPPYYLIEQRGDGNFTRMDTPGTPQLSVPMWVIGTF